MTKFEERLLSRQEEINRVNKDAYVVFFVMAFLLLFICVGFVKYKIGVEEAVFDFFKTCHKVDNTTMQCPIPKENK